MGTNLVEIFKHNLWANRRMIEVCSRLSDEQLDASAPGTYGTIRATLVHLVGAEERYVSRYLGSPPPPLRLEENFAGMDDLLQSATASGQALIEIASKERDSAPLSWKAMDGRTYQVERPVLLLQAVNHATEHRAHVNTVLVNLGLEPLDLDGWSYAEEHGLMEVGEAPTA